MFRMQNNKKKMEKVLIMQKKFVEAPLKTNIFKIIAYTLFLCQMAPFKGGPRYKFKNSKISKSAASPTNRRGTRWTVVPAWQTRPLHQTPG